MLSAYIRSWPAVAGVLFCCLRSEIHRIFGRLLEAWTRLMIMLLGFWTGTVLWWIAFAYGNGEKGGF